MLGQHLSNLEERFTHLDSERLCLGIPGDDATIAVPFASVYLVKHPQAKPSICAAKLTSPGERKRHPPCRTTAGRSKQRIHAPGHRRNPDPVRFSEIHL